MEYTPADNVNSLSCNLTDYALKLINKTADAYCVAIIEFCEIGFKNLGHNACSCRKYHSKQYNALNISLTVLDVVQSQYDNKNELEDYHIVIEHGVEIKICTCKEMLNIICAIYKIGIYNHKEHQSRNNSTCYASDYILILSLINVLMLYI